MQDQVDDNIDNERNEKLAELYTVQDTFPSSEVLTSVLLESLDDINQKILANNFLTLKRPDLIGSTVLHFALEKHNLKLFKFLLNEGADYCIKNRQHSTVLHGALKDSNYLKNYWEHDLQFTLGDPYSFECPFTDSVLEAHLDSGNFSNPCNENGLSHFHIACLANNPKAVEFFLLNGISSNETIKQNSLLLPGFTSLHIVAKYCNVQVAKILLNNNADKDLQDVRGLSCLHVLIEERLKYSFCKSMRKRLRKDKTAFIIYMNGNQMIIELLLGETSTWNPNVTDSIGLSHFHVACTLQDASLIQKLIQEVSNINHAVNVNSPIWPGYTALHFAAHFEFETVKLLIKHGANLGMADAEGLTPFEICLQRFTAEEICSILKLRPDWESIVFSDNKTKLFDFIHATRSGNAFADFLKNEVADINMFVSLDSPVAAGYTPLHFAVIATGIAKTNLKDCESADYQALSNFNGQNNTPESLTYYRKILACLDLGADVTIQDKRRLTPIHHSFQLHEYIATTFLLKRHDKIVNVIDANGVSHFHIACVVLEPKLMELLLSEKRTINDSVGSPFTYLTKIENNLFSLKINKGSTPLHIAVTLRSPPLTEFLVKYDVDISSVNSNGLNPLDLALAIHKQEMLLPKRNINGTIPRQVFELLIGCKVKVLAQKYNSYIPLKQILDECDVLLRNLLVLELGQNLIERCILDDMGITKLHVACALGDIVNIKQLLNEGANVDEQIRLDSPIWPGCTPLNVWMSLPLNVVIPKNQPYHVWITQYLNLLSLNSTDDSEAVQLLLDHGADVTIGNAEQSTPIHQGFERLWYGDNHLSHAPLKFFGKKFHLSPYFNLLIKAQKNFDVNPVSVRRMSHFHVACALNEVETVKKFLEHGVNLSQKINSFSEDFGGYTALHFAVHYESKDSIDLLLNYGADVSIKDVLGNTALHIFATYSPLRLDILQSIISREVDINNPTLVGETFLTRLLETKKLTTETINVFKKQRCQFNAYNAATNQGFLAGILETNSETVIEAMFNALDIIEVDEAGRTLIHNSVSIIKHSGDRIPEDLTVEDMFIPPQTYCDAIEKLISHGFDIDHQDKEGLTALHIASQRRNYSGIIGLLMCGADFNVTDAAGKSAFSYSMEMANTLSYRTPVDTEILKIFLKHVFKMVIFVVDITEENVNLAVSVKRLENRYLLQEEQRLDNEIAKMDDEKWCTCLPSIKLQSFLELGPVEYCMMSKQNREKVDEFFKNSIGVLHQEFPEFSGILLLQYRQARARFECIQLANNCFSQVVGIEMPFLCAEAIFKFLRNDDLKNIIISSNLVLE